MPRLALLFKTSTMPKTLHAAIQHDNNDDDEDAARRRFMRWQEPPQNMPTAVEDADATMREPYHAYDNMPTQHARHATMRDAARRDANMSATLFIACLHATCPLLRALRLHVHHATITSYATRRAASREYRAINWFVNICRFTAHYATLTTHYDECATLCAE